MLEVPTVDSEEYQHSAAENPSSVPNGSFQAQGQVWKRALAPKNHFVSELQPRISWPAVQNIDVVINVLQYGIISHPPRCNKVWRFVYRTEEEIPGKENESWRTIALEPMASVGFIYQTTHGGYDSTGYQTRDKVGCWLLACFLWWELRYKITWRKGEQKQENGKSEEFGFVRTYPVKQKNALLKSWNCIRKTRQAAFWLAKQFFRRFCVRRYHVENMNFLYW